MCHAGSGEEEDAQECKWKIPWVIGMCGRCQSRSKDASGRQRVSALGSVDERAGRGERIQ
jgi:hypothetical protein